MLPRRQLINIMTFLFIIRAACSALFSNGLRTALTTLSLVIGVAAMIMVESVGQGAKESVWAELTRMGTKVILIGSGPRAVSGVRAGQGSMLNLTVADAAALKEQIPLVTKSAWARGERMQLIHGHHNWNGAVYGISPDLLPILEYTMRSGLPISRKDMDLGAKVALIGATVTENLFEMGEEPVGTVIRIKNMPFEVIGVLGAKGHLPSGRDQDDIVMIPYTTAEQKVLASQFRGVVGAISASTDRVEDLLEAAAEVREVLRERHHLQLGQPDDFKVQTTLDGLLAQEAANDTLAVMMIAIASISFLVGGVGIANIVLISINERMREIGIRLAVGAKRLHILFQFLIEAMVLGGVGGILGIILGCVAAQIATSVTDWPTIITQKSISLAFVSSLAVSLVFAIGPAYKAASLNPIDALR
jgi:putative ABC transport system permease protein